MTPYDDPLAAAAGGLRRARAGGCGWSRSPSRTPAAQLAALAVLRRPQSAADRSTGVGRVLKLLGTESAAGIHVDGIRAPRRRAGGLVVLIPMQRCGPPGHGVRDGLCLMNAIPGGGAGGTCGTLADLERSHIGWPQPPYGLVPDGVARVRLRVRGGRTIAAPVRGNAYSVAGDDFAIQPPVWLDAQGRTVPKQR